MRRIHFLLTGGAFLALVLMIAALAANAIYQIERQQRQMNTVVELHDRKIDVVTNTQIASRGRTDRLLRMAIEHDPFARDQLYLEFNRAGFEVGKGRRQQLQLGMTEEERRIFDEQTALIRRIEPMQEKVTDYLANGQVDKAWNLLIAEGIPMQERLNELLAELRNKMRQANELALMQARQDYRNHLYFTLLFGFSATGLGIGLAWYSLRSMAANARELHWQIAALEESRAAFENEATHDTMTGLANRKLFYDRLGQALLQARRHNGKVGVLFVDLNNFKTINDLYGHQVGDALLAEVARRLVGSVRESDTVARAGGDEFLVILGDPTSHEDCLAVIEKILADQQEKVHLDGVDLTISASIGHAIYPDDGLTEDELIRAADASMYRSKNGHRAST